MARKVNRSKLLWLLALWWSDAVPDGLLARLLADESADPAHPRRPWLIG